MTLKLLTEHDLDFLSLKGGCTGSSEFTLVNMPHCWKSHVAAHMIVAKQAGYSQSTYMKYSGTHKKKSCTRDMPICDFSLLPMLMLSGCHMWIVHCSVLQRTHMVVKDIIM